jgi:hypothetical protein
MTQSKKYCVYAKMYKTLKDSEKVKLLHQTTIKFSATATQTRNLQDTKRHFIVIK